MMHGHEKSDSAIVAVKPANKAAHPAVEQSAVGLAAAELVEPRTETKGNADQQSTCRAQSRVSVSQALERIRKVAKERKKERFTALFHHISPDLLEEAFYELKEDAAPGVATDRWNLVEVHPETFMTTRPGVFAGGDNVNGADLVVTALADGRRAALAIHEYLDSLPPRNPA